jgi:cation transport ATPase
VKLLVRTAIFIGFLYLIGLSSVALAFFIVTGDVVPKLFYIQMGIVGTVFIIVSLGYVFRKHYLKKLSQMKAWLDVHVLTGSIGTILILFHSEFHFRALVPALAVITMLMVVVSGVIGRYLISKVLKQISMEKAQRKKAQKEHEKVIEGNEILLQEKEDEDDLMVLVFSQSIMKHWKLVHLHLTPLPVVLTILHVISEFYYRGLRL